MLDMKQLQLFIDLLVGHRPVGMDQNGNEATVPESPAIHAFVTARLGELTPLNGWECTAKIGDNRFDQKREAFAGFLREVADGIAPKGALTVLDGKAPLLAAVDDFLTATASRGDNSYSDAAWMALATARDAAGKA